MILDATFYLVQEFYGKEAEEFASKMNFYKYENKDLAIEVKTTFLHLHNNWPLEKYLFDETVDCHTATLDIYSIKDMYSDVREAMDSYDSGNFYHMGFRRPDDNYDDFYYSQLKELRDAFEELIEIYYHEEKNKTDFYVEYKSW